jgi:hypothetical protein
MKYLSILLLSVMLFVPSAFAGHDNSTNENNQPSMAAAPLTNGNYSSLIDLYMMSFKTTEAEYISEEISKSLQEKYPAECRVAAVTGRTNFWGLPYIININRVRYHLRMGCNGKDLKIISPRTPKEGTQKQAILETERNLTQNHKLTLMSAYSLTENGVDYIVFKTAFGEHKIPLNDIELTEEVRFPMTVYVY